MSKKIVLVLLGLIFTFTLFNPNTSVEAKQNSKQDSKSLSLSERDYLSQVLNFSDDEINSMPLQEAKFLVENNAEIVTSFNEIYTMNEGTLEKQSTSPSVVSPLATIPSGDLSFSGAILKLKGTIANYDAFYAYSDFRWLKKPLWALTDKVTIGFPSNLGVYMPASGGKLQGFSSSYSLYNTSTRSSTLISSTTTPSYFDPSGGVAAAFNLRTTINVNQTHAGRVSQTFHVKTEASGNATVKFEYGHRKISGTVGVSLYPSGVGITPATNTDLKAYYVSFSY